jgi:hypothetical protein
VARGLISLVFQHLLLKTTLGRLTPMKVHVGVGQLLAFESPTTRFLVGSSFLSI